MIIFNFCWIPNLSFLYMLMSLSFIQIYVCIYLIAWLHISLGLMIIKRKISKKLCVSIRDEANVLDPAKRVFYTGSSNSNMYVVALLSEIPSSKNHGLYIISSFLIKSLCQKVYAFMFYIYIYISLVKVIFLWLLNQELSCHFT